MAGLQDIKRRIGSIKTTKKITKAMELVASAKFGRLKKEHEAIADYASGVNKIIQDLIAQSDDLAYLNRKEGKTLWIIINSSLGLCGGYNSSINKLVIKDANEDDLFITVGSKARQFFGTRKYEIVKSFNSLSKPVDYDEASLISQEIEKLFFDETKKIKSVKIGYTHFINAATMEPTVLEMFPVSQETPESNKGGQAKAMTLYEPDINTVIKAALPLYIGATVYGCLSHSFTSEESSRRTAMEAATDNAEEIQQKLELEFNRKRQAAITQEIAEIVAGANAS